MGIKRNFFKVLMLIFIFFRSLTFAEGTGTLGGDSGGTDVENSFGKNITLIKTVDSATYVPGEEVRYTISITNNSQSSVEFNLEDKFSQIKTTVISGAPNDYAYSKVVVSGGTLGSSREYDGDEDLSLTAQTINGNSTLTYTLEATINKYAIGDILNITTMIDPEDDENRAEASAKVSPNNISVSLSKLPYVDGVRDASKNDYYTASSTDLPVYYEITIENKEATPAKNLRIDTLVSYAMASPLEGIAYIDVFSSWKALYEISRGTTSRMREGLVGEDIVPRSHNKDLSGITDGEWMFSSTTNSDFSHYLDLGPNEIVVIKLKGIIKGQTVASEIPYGEFDLDTKIYNGSSKLAEKEATVKPTKEEITVSKSAELITTDTTTTGVKYTVEVKNGETAGYAKGLTLEDALKGMEFQDKDEEVFASWNIGTPSLIGEGTKVDNETTTNGLLATGVDIAPGGSVKYIIDATLKPSTTGTTIVNTAQVRKGGTAIGEGSVTTFLGEDKGDLQVFKTADVSEIRPNKEVVYTIRIVNEGKNPSGSIDLTDIVSSNPSTNLGNSSHGSAIKGVAGNEDTTDVLGNTYKKILIPVSIEYTAQGKTPIGGNYVYEDTDEVKLIVFELAGKTDAKTDEVEIKITAIPNKVLLGGVEVANKVTVNWKGLSRSTTNYLTVNTHDKVDRDFYDKSGNKIGSYTPNQEIEYRVTLDSYNTTPMNNMEIKEEFLGSITNQATKELIFKPGYELTVTRKNYTTNTTTTKTYNKIPDDIVDLAADEKITYSLTGSIREDVVGTIDNGYTDDKRRELLPKPYDLSLTKEFLEADGSKADNYFPGEDLWIKLRVDNISEESINAYQVYIEDKISEMMVEPLQGDVDVSAFDLETLIVEKITGPNGDITKTPENSKITTSGDLEAVIDIPSSGWVEYLIKGTVNSNAKGEMSNTAAVYSGKDAEKPIKSVTVTLGSSFENKLNFEKTVIEYLDKDEQVIPDKEGYVPGGYVRYKLNLKNTGRFNMTTVVYDDLTEIKTQGIEYGVVLDGQEVFESATLIIRKKGLDGNLLEIIQTEETITDNKINEEVILEGDTQLEYEILGKINTNIIGKFKNTAMITLKDTDPEKEVEVESEESSPLPPDISIDKKAVDEGGNEVTTYIKDEYITYLIKVENGPNSHGVNLTVEDLLSEVTNEPFDMTDVTITVEENLDKDNNGKPDVSITTEGPRSNGDLKDVIAMEPDSSITYKIVAKVKDTATGDIGGHAKVKEGDTLIDEDDALLTELVQHPSIEAEMYITEGITEGEYGATDTVTYYLKVKNTGDTNLKDIKVKHLITDIEGSVLGSTTKENVFTSLKRDGVDIDTETEAITLSLDIGQEKIYKFDGVVKENILGNFEPKAEVSSDKCDQTEDLSVLYKPEAPKLKTTKDVEKEPLNGKYYTLEDETITYILTLTNKSGINLEENVIIEDVISSLSIRDGIETIPLFTDWGISLDEEDKDGNSVNVNDFTSDVIKGKDIDGPVTLLANEGNKIVIKVIGDINEEINGLITNVFRASVVIDGTTYGDSAEETVDVKTSLTNEGMLDIAKRAMKDEVKIGEPVEYEVLIENNTDSIFEATLLKDIIPAGFRYVANSTEAVHIKADGSEEVLKIEPTQTNSLKYELPNLDIGDKVQIRYILTPGIGVSFGKYKNQAYVIEEDGTKKSEIASATVSIQADSLLDTASIIGKVFFDHNKNGRQDEDYHEWGIPGVRLISPRGIIAVTDRFGRYHLPDVWVYNKLGQVGEVKLDVTTLPTNTKVISENPQIKRITSSALTKFNFSVAVEDDKFAIDTTRIYLEEGAIWLVNDFVDLEQELSLSFPERIIVKDNKLTEEVEFSIDTNYADFISHYELAIYSQRDRKMEYPIKVIRGNKLYNDITLKWDDLGVSSEDLVVGRDLKVRLRVWDKNSREDKTEVGYINLVARKPILDLFSYESQGSVELLTKNIKLNGGMVRIEGDGLDGISNVIVADDDYDVDDNEFMGMRFVPSGEHILPVKLIYEDGHEEDYTLTSNYKDTYYIGTAMLDLNFDKYNVKGNRETLGEDNPYGANYYEDKIYNEGRLTVFGKGRYKDKIRFTTYIDTKTRDLKDMFDDIFEKDDQTVFERVQDTDTYYYPTYGDKSYVYRHVDTDGDIYFKAEYEDSYLMWGNYETEINHAKYMNYNRSLYGAKLDYVSSNKTDYGDEDRLIAFMSKPYSLFGHDEFLGTGGSLYFLKNNDVLNGSEKVYIKVVNSLTDRTESTIDLVEGRDYDFDPFQGRIILNKPLKSNASAIDDEIIQSGASGDYYNYLVVDYEYIPSSDEGLSEKDYGVYVNKFLGKHLGIGGTYVKENRDGTDYRMKGAELTLKFTENSYIKGEVSESEGVQSLNSFVSLDGGLTFSDLRDDPGEITGQAYNAVAVINLGDIAPNLFGGYGNELTTWYEQKDAGYSFASDLEDTYIESYGSRLTLRHSDRILSSLKYEEYEERDGINKIKGALKDKYKAVTAEVEYLLTDRLTTSFAYKYIKEMIDVDGNDQMAAANIIGMRLEYEANDDLTLYAEGQGTVSRDDGYETNNRVTVGFDADVTENLSVNGSTSVGTRGNYSELGIDYDLTDNYSIYVGATSDGEENQDDLTFGQKMKISDKVEIYQESQILKEDDRMGRADTYGIDYDYNDDLTIGASFQYGKIELPDDEGEARRKAFSLYTDYDTVDFDMRNKLEYREDKEDGSGEKTKQYLTTNYFDYVHNDEVTFGGKFNYAYTDDETENESSKFIEGSIGVAFRPVENDKLNYLARYTYILNDDPNDGESLKAHIAEFEAICEAGEKLDLGLKLAYRDEEETYIRESGEEIGVDNALYLIGLRANYVIMNDWDIYAEYHWLVERHTHDVRDGAVVGIYKNVHENLKLGGGYNFSGFSSDLSQEDYEAHGWFVNIVGRF